VKNLRVIKHQFYRRFKIRRMNQRHLWTIVTLFLAVLGIPSVGRTQTTKGATIAAQKLPATDVAKVGEYQSPTGSSTLGVAVTEIYPHRINGRQAATLFVRNIPVITFISSTPVSNLEKKVGSLGGWGNMSPYALISTNTTKVASIGNVMGGVITNDPIQKASIVAARVNQLIQDNVDASKITVSWKSSEKSAATINGISRKGASVRKSLGDRYMIKFNGQELVELDENTRLADATRNPPQDALQATNRLRRLIGNASPIHDIADLPLRRSMTLPRLPDQIAIGGLRINFKGIASWYGYDGSSSSTASGERYNPEGLTAAHRSLPLGTKVRVTNTSNGRSVVVRINDRGPYVGGRIIDLSAAAARLLGMMGSGIAPVHIEVLGR
jgi:rare lipoprotein A